MNTSPKIAQQPRNIRTLSPLKTVFGLLFISLLMGACVSSQPRFTQQQMPESRVALVVGNANYASQDITDLSNPSRDARDMAQTLRQVGFEVIEVHDADESTMKTKFEEFGAKLKATPQKDGKKVALFYYSGHGALKDGKSYLISVDANLPKEETETEALFKKASLAEEMVTDEPSEDNTPEATATEASSSKAGAGLIPLTTLFKEINQVADTTTNLFILDACRDNPLLVAKNDQGQQQGATKNIKGLGWSDEVEEEIRRSDQVPDPKNSLIAYATARGEVAQDGEGLNSPYTQRLLKQMTETRLKCHGVISESG
jgi:uncharacterized caspase-like protein